MYTGNELSLRKRECLKFIQEIGFFSVRKNDRLKLFNDNPHYNTYNLDFQDTIASISPCGITDVFDLTTSSKQFSAGGIVVHNCPEEAFQANLEGNYYSKYMTKARVERRIGNVPHDENLPVFVAMDLGFNDAMAIWWYQKLGAELRLIDYYENSGEPLAHYIKVIKNKPYVVERVFAPHDASSHELGSGLTRVQIARNLGLDFTVLPRLGLQEGVDAVRNLLNRCWFDEVKCEKGIRALENYRKEWNETLGVWRDHPRHDHFSNGADGFRYLAMSLKRATTQADDEKEYRRHLQAFHEPQHSLYGDFPIGTYY